MKRMKIFLMHYMHSDKIIISFIKKLLHNLSFVMRALFSRGPRCERVVYDIKPEEIGTFIQAIGRNLDIRIL